MNRGYGLNSPSNSADFAFKFPSGYSWSLNFCNCFNQICPLSPTESILTCGTNKYLLCILIFDAVV